MSVAKINTVQSARKDQGECEKCHDPLPAGSAYRWFIVGFRSNYKRRRCMKPECTPRTSERESSKLADVYAAQEDFDVQSATTVEDITTAVADVAEAVRAVADEYTEASTDDSGNVFNTDAEERASVLEGSADELESWEPDATFEPCEEHADAVDAGDDGFEVTDEGPQYECPDCTEAWDTFLDTVRDEAQQAVDDMEMP